jgi:hypothetical protein
MFLRFFKSGQPAFFFIIPVLAVLLWLKYLIIPQPVNMVFEPNPMPFYSWLFALLENQVFLGKGISLVLHVFIALWLSRLNTKFILLNQRTYLPAIIYLLFISSYLPLQQLNPAVFSAVFLVLAVELMFDAYKKEGLALEFFMTAFLVSLASLFYARAALLMLVVWMGLSLLRAVRWREWAFTILGFLTPYVFLFSWYYLSGQDLAGNWESIRYNFVHDRGTGYLDISYFVFYGYMLLLVILASRKMLTANQGLKIYIRKFFRLNFWLFTFIMAAFLIIYSRAIEMICFVAIPVSYILSWYLTNIRSKLAGEILFCLIFAGYIMLLILN